MFRRQLTSALIALVVAVSIYSLNTTRGKPDIEIITHTPVLDEILEKHAEYFPDSHQLTGYRNHCLRVLCYTVHFLKPFELSNEDRISIEAALAYHDLGLWSDSKLSYIDPSVDRAMEDLKNDSRFNLSLISDVIRFHHKLTPMENAPIVEAVRKADWIDASHGVVKHGMSTANVDFVQKQLSNSGFHVALLNFPMKIRSFNLPLAVYELLQIFKW